MKQSDIITVVIIAVVGTLAAYFIVNGLMGNPADASFDFKNIELITSELASPDPEVFNSEAINPTVEVYVGECKDLDHNDKIDNAERAVCGERTGLGNVEDEPEDELLSEEEDVWSEFDNLEDEEDTSSDEDEE